MMTMPEEQNSLFLSEEEKTQGAAETHEGRKDDAGKPEWSLMPMGSIEQVLGVLMHGKKKYSADNWKKVPDAKDRYFNAAMRHLMAWHKGEKQDQESGLAHLAHAACCLLFLMWVDSIAKKITPKRIIPMCNSCGVDMESSEIFKEDERFICTAWICPKCFATVKVAR